MRFTQILSIYTKKKLKETSFCDREYIKGLMLIEELARGNSFGIATGYMLKELPAKYPIEWKSIWQELNPEGYKEIEDQDIVEWQKKECEPFEKKNKKEWLDWMEAGGSL